MIVTNKEARVHWVGDEIVLYPGANEVEQKQWDALRKLPAVSWYLKSGAFVEHGRESFAGAAELPTADAVRLASETMQEEALQRMRMTEKRPEVLAAIAAQLDKVKLPMLARKE